MAKAQIMVVEDEGIIAKLIQTMLKDLGYTVSSVTSSGEEAVKKAQENKPDLVLMDIRLKEDMDGIEATEQIQTRFDIPVVYLTAYADEDTLHQAKATEPYGYILKPIQVRELHAVIETALYKHRVERKLKESKRWLAATLNSIADAVIATDKKGAVVFMNSVAEVLTGWKQKDAAGKDLADIFKITNEGTRTLSENPAAKALRGSAATDPTNHILIAKDGTEIPIDDRAAPIRDDKGNITGAVLVFRDITERKETEKKIHAYQKRLRSLVSKLTIAEERQRRRIAEELHHSIGQSLALGKIKLGQLKKVITSPDSTTLLEEIRSLLEQIIQSSRSLSFQLSLPILRELGLEEALEWLAEYMYKQQGIRINLEVDSQVKRVDEELRVFLFRAVQELLVNVVKHAKTDKAKVSLGRKDEGIRITVKDRGVGFNPAILEDSSDQERGFGLFSIRERLRYIGGELSLQSKPGQGTQVTLVVPSKRHRKRGKERGDEHPSSLK